MNPRLDRLQRYPFERLATLKAPLRAPAGTAHIALSIGEPKHAPPDIVLERLTNPELLRADLGTYPATRGSDALRESIAAWVQRRFGARMDAATEVLPVAGTREALFSFAQAVMSGSAGAVALMPNPFYQIYEGAVLLAGGEPRYVGSYASNGYQANFDEIDAATWQRTELVYLCSPSNPTGTVMAAAELQRLIERAVEHDFVIASDECYSEIYLDEASPPTGLLEACKAVGNDSYRNCVVFQSLSKRSNLPGLRSGFVAGDAQILERYFLYRTYQGCALPMHTQAASALAWADETHVVSNRAQYREKFAAVRDVLGPYAPASEPEGAFFYWLPTGMDAETFAARAFEQEHVTVLPGPYLSRSDGAAEAGNPGDGHVRIAWVAPLSDCIEGATRLRRVFDTLHRR